MTADQIFSISNPVAMVGWLILIFAGRKKWAASLVTGVVIPLLFAILYTTLILGHWGERTGGFGSLSEVMALFTNQWLVLAGWVHYLAFDLFVGSWEVRDAVAYKIPHIAVVPCLVLTFLFGPIGFLLYVAIRYAMRRSISTESPNS